MIGLKLFVIVDSKNSINKMIIKKSGQLVTPLSHSSPSEFTQGVEQGIKIFLMIVLLGTLVCGCSTSSKPIQNFSMQNDSSSYKDLDNSYWWRCNFKNVWPDDKRPDFVIDLLLAHAVVSPVLSQHIKDIPYWRFHRRAARDQAGHQFSLLFYSKPEVASSVFSAISKSEILQSANAANLVEKVMMDNPSYPGSSDIEATSDDSWSLELQKTWPSFIMGVSSLWLGLIEEYFQEAPQDYTDIHELLEKYRTIDAEIGEIWKKEGQHALLHHLNAVFGYKPLRISKELSF